MGKALYRTYRSKKLSEIVGQEHITTALAHALEKGTVSHAYLFTGPRGVGKTSIARILAHEINGLPYDEDRQHLDIIEIDAASNRRIDEIRDLRDKVHIAPSNAKFKVYIIDEVHMLTKEAFNALLKTLEEPPTHCVFILATTEVHKLPETIVSRTQRYAFKPVDMAKVIAHLRHIADSENVAISDEALALIAAHGEGSFRDSISLLDQVRNAGGKVELADVQTVLGIAPDQHIHVLIDALNSHDSIAVAQTLTQMHNHGYEPAQIARQLSKRLRSGIIEGKAETSHDTAMKLLSSLVLVPASPDPRIALEIALLDAALSDAPRKTTAKATPESPAKVMPEDVQTRPAIEEKPQRKAALTPKPETITPEPTPAPAKPADDKKIAEAKASMAKEPVTADSDLVLNEEAWQMILNAVKPKYNTLYSILRTAEPKFEPGKLTLEVPFAFHQKRLNEVKNKELLSEIITGVIGSDILVHCEKGTGRTPPPPTTPMPPADGEIAFTAAPAPVPETQKPPQDPVASISNIFGGAEVLES